MATILEFRRPEDGASGQTTERQPDEGISRSAEIIIFPGVRIERQSGPEGGEPSAKSGKSTNRAARREL